MNFNQLLQRTLRYIAARVPKVANWYFAEEYRQNTKLFFAILAAQPGQEKRINHSGLPRLFYVSPLPPDQSGIAKYSTDWLPKLLPYFDIVLVHPCNTYVKLENEQFLTVKSPSWMLNHADPRDIVLYHIGNSPFHTYMLELMQQLPGHVVLHDVYLSHLFYHELSANKNHDLVVRHLYQSEGRQALLDMRLEPYYTDKILSYPCAKKVLTDSRHVFVYSRHARQLVNQHYGEEVAARVSVLNMPIVLEQSSLEEKRISCRMLLGIPDHVILVCCFGILQSSKRNSDIVKAWLSLGWHKDSNMRLVFVGGYNPADPYAQGLIESLEKSADQESNIEVLGWVDDICYQNHLYACDFAVQLRNDTRGETSAALLRTLGSGLPTIVNAHGSMSEIPSEVVCLLPDQFSNNQLQTALVKLASDTEQRRAFGIRAREYIQANHNPEMLAAEFAELLTTRHGTSITKITAWVDCSILFLLGDASKSLLNEYTAIFQHLAESDCYGVDFQFVRYCIESQCFKPYPQVHNLPEGGLVEVFYQQISRLRTPKVLFVDPRLKWFSSSAVRKCKKTGAHVYYLKPSELSVAARLCDQVR